MAGNNSNYGHNKTTKRRKAWDVKEPKIRHETNSRERVDLNPEAFDRLIQQKGVIAKVYRTLYCPNVKSVDGAEHEIDCELCNGSGFLDVDPICVSVYIQTQELNEMPQIEGFVDGNTIMVTFPIGVEVQYFTKVELHDHTQVFPQRVNRKKGSLIDVLKYPACRINVLVDKNNVRYYEGIDVSLDFNGNVKWLKPGDAQLLTFSAVPDAGTFTITQGTNTTAALGFGSSAAQVQAALRLLPGFEEVTVSGNFTVGFTIVWVGVDAPVALATTNSLLVADEESVTIVVTDKSAKARKPNDNQPYSIHYEAKVQYRAFAAIHASRFTQVAHGEQIEHIKMPDQWYCKKEFLVKRVDTETGVELEQGPWGKKHEIVVEEGGDESN